MQQFGQAKMIKPSYTIRKLLTQNTEGLTTRQIFEHVHNLKETAKPEHIRGRISEMTKRGLLTRHGSTILITQKGIDYHNNEVEILGSDYKIEVNN